MDDSAWYENDFRPLEVSVHDATKEDAKRAKEYIAHLRRKAVFSIAICILVLLTCVWVILIARGNYLLIAVGAILAYVAFFVCLPAIRYCVKLLVSTFRTSKAELIVIRLPVLQVWTIEQPYYYTAWFIQVANGQYLSGPHDWYAPHRKHEKSPGRSQLILEYYSMRVRNPRQESMPWPREAALISVRFAGQVLSEEKGAMAKRVPGFSYKTIWYDSKWERPTMYRMLIDLCEGGVGQAKSNDNGTITDFE